MKKQDIKVGGHYLAKVSNKVVTVRVDAIRERTGKYIGASKVIRDQTVFDVTNLTTGRKTTFRSAAKFRSEVKEDKKRPDPTQTSGPAPSATAKRAGKTGPARGGKATRAAEDMEDVNAVIEEGWWGETNAGAIHDRLFPEQAKADREARDAGYRKTDCPACNGFGTLPGGGECKTCGRSGKVAGRGANVEGEQSHPPLPTLPSSTSTSRPHATGVVPKSCRGRSISKVAVAVGEDKQCSDPTNVRSVAAPQVTAGVSTRSSGLAAALKAAPKPNNAPHLIIEARAGTGKTTTLVEGLKVVRGLLTSITPSPQQQAIWDQLALSKGCGSVCFVAFNKSIATELQRRVPAGCDAMTMHSMGFKAVQKALGRMEPDQYVVQDIIAELLGMDLRELRRTKPVVLKATEDLVGLCKQNLIGQDFSTEVQSREEFGSAWSDCWSAQLSKLASHYEVDLDIHRQEVFDLVPRVLERCQAPKGKINFDDMVWLPVVLNLLVYRYDLLLVDEAQDLNRCQQALAKKAGKRLVLCGDPRQAIYGFAGADAESMKRMEEELGAQVFTEPTDRALPNPLSEPGNITIKAGSTMTWRSNELGILGSHSKLIGLGVVKLPLTVTRRCGKAIVKEAQRIVSDFEAHKSNPDGRISYAVYPDQKDSGQLSNGHPQIRELRPEEKANLYSDQVRDGDFILCRVNAPLVSQCFRFIKAGRKATIQGRDIGAGLIATVKKLNKGYRGAGQVTDLVRELDNWHRQETAKEQAKTNPDEAKLIALTDRYDCLLCFTEGVNTVQEVITKIESVFTDDKETPGIRLSSIHKAKGLEAKRVFLLRPEGGECPHPMAKSAWQREQEMNLLYVAITRAIEELIFVS